MEHAEEIKKLLGDIAAGREPQGEAAAVAAEAVAAMPYATAAWIATLRTGAASGVDEARARVVLGSSDRRTVAAAASGASWTDFYPPETPAEHATADVIDTFLNTYGRTSPEEEALLERMIFNPTPDYGELLAREEQENLPSEPVDTASDDGRIAAFILSHHPATHSPEAVPPVPDDIDETGTVAPPPKTTDDSLLSEALAAVFIKQRRYERAFDIISSLNLKFPKKSAYFADQLRFLRKLIIIERHAKEAEARKS